MQKYQITPYSPSKKVLYIAYSAVFAVIVFIAFIASSIVSPTFAKGFDYNFLNGFFKSKQSLQESISQPPVPSMFNEEQGLKEFFASPSPTVAPTATPTPSPTVRITPKPNPTQNCIHYKIPSGVFKSDKCYSQKDYSLLANYLADYNMAIFKYNTAISTMKFVCDGSEFFKNSCDEAKKRRDDAKHDIDSLKSKIKAIIAAGV